MSVIWILYIMRNTEKNYSKLLQNLSKNIKAARLKKNYRQADMIEYGFSERYFQKLESGVYSPNLYTMQRLATAFETTVDKLLKPKS